MPDMILLEAEEKMNKTIEALRKEFAQVRTGKASTSVLDAICIDYYGVNTPIKQVAAITAPEAAQLVIKPYDKSSLKQIEAAIGGSDIGLTPQNDGSSIRLSFPRLTEERRKELVKTVDKNAESSKITIRNIRRETNDLLKKLSLPEDEEKGYMEDVQKLTDTFIHKIEDNKKSKETEIMTV